MHFFLIRLFTAILPLCLVFNAHAATKLPVVVSFSILGDMVQQVGGEFVSVSTLVGPDGDSHVYQPSPQDVTRVAGAKVLVMNGLGFEGWMARLAKASRFGGVTITASEHITPQKLDANSHDHDHGHGQLDPHAWQDPARARQYVSNIAKGLSQADPSNAAHYQARATAYIAQLTELERWAQQAFAEIPPAKRRVITSHDAFGYLGRRFGVTFLSPQGMNTEAEASAKDVANLIRQIRKEKLAAVFVENISNPKLIEQVSREAGIQLGGRLYSDALSQANGPASNYLAMMRHNIGSLIVGMRRN